MATDTELEDDELDQQDDESKKKPIGKPLQGDSNQIANAPIGKPIVPPKQSSDVVSSTNIIPGVDTGTTPPAMPETPLAGLDNKSDTIGTPISQPTGQGSQEYQQAADRLNKANANTGRHSTIGKVLESIALSTKFGAPIELATGTGAIGRQARVGEAERGLRDVTGQITEGERERQANTTVANTQAQEGLRQAQTGLAENKAEATLNPPAKSVAPKVPPPSKVTHTYVDDQGNEVGVFDNGDIKTLTKVQPKPIHTSKPTASEESVQDHLKTMGLPDTPENRDKARSDMQEQKVEGAANAKGDAAVNELGKSANQAYKRLQALSADYTDPSNYAFLMSFIGMSYEAIKGARLNQAEIVRAAATRTLPDELQHAYDLYIDKRILTPTQKQNMLHTAQIIAESYGDNKGEPSRPKAEGTPANSRAGAGSSGPTSKVLRFGEFNQN